MGYWIVEGRIGKEKTKVFVDYLSWIVIILSIFMLKINITHIFFASQANLFRKVSPPFSFLLFLSYYSVMTTTFKSLSKTKRSYSETFRQNIYTHRQPLLKNRFNDQSSTTFLNHPSNNNLNSKSSTLKQTNNIISSLKSNPNIE